MGATPPGRGPAHICLIVIESIGIVRASLRLVFAADPDLVLLEKPRMRTRDWSWWRPFAGRACESRSSGSSSAITTPSG